EQDKPPRGAVLDALFSDLAKARTAQEGAALQQLIQKVWLQSGSPSIDILMSRGLDAVDAKDYDRAMFYFNEVVVLDPGFSEGWHKRATVFIFRTISLAHLPTLNMCCGWNPASIWRWAGSP